MRTRAVVLGLSMAALAGCESASNLAKPVEVPVPSPTTATRALIQSLSSPDPEVRSRSAWSLAGATELEGEARRALKPLESDGQKTVRYAAVWALSHLRKGKDEPDLVGARAAEGEWTPPKPISSPRPNYPQEAFVAKVQGTVLVEMLVGEEGEVAHLEIRQSIPALDAAAMDCVRRWRFDPAKIDGTPRATVAQIPVAFRIY